MNATPLLSRLLAACAAEHLEIVLIGNAAAAPARQRKRS